MLHSPLSHALKNDYLAERFRLAYEFLQRDDLGELPLGRIDISGDEVYANIFEYDTVPAPDKYMEAHRRYYDIHFLVSGRELAQYTSVEGLISVGEYDEETDCCLYGTAPFCSSALLTPGQVIIFAPEDAHKPGCTYSKTSSVRKVVVKVLA